MAWALCLDHSKEQVRGRVSWCVPRFIPTKLLLSFLLGREDGKAKEIPVSAVIAVSSRAASVHLALAKAPSRFCTVHFLSSGMAFSQLG